MEGVWELGLTDEQFRLLMALARHAQDDGSQCFPGVELLAAETQRSERAVQRGLRQLEAAGHILPVAHRHGGRGHSTQYQLVIKGDAADTLYPHEPVDKLGITPAQGTERVTEVSPFEAERVTFMVVKGDASVTPIGNEPVSTPVSEPVRTKTPVDPRIATLWGYYREKVQPAARECPTDQIRARLKRFSVEDLQAGIDHFAADPWWMEHNAHRGGQWFFHSNARSEQFLLMQPRPHSPANGHSPPVGRRPGDSRNPADYFKSAAKR